MSAEPLVVNLLAWSAQAALLIAVALFLGRRFPLDPPRLRLVLLRAVLGIVLLLPLLQPARPLVALGSGLEVTVGVLADLARVQPRPGSSISLGQVVLGLLALGGVSRLVWMGIGLSRLGRLRRQAVPLALPAELRELPRQLGVVAPILESSRIARPVTLGFLRPAVVLPAGLDGQPLAGLRSVLCHELLHVRRRDGIQLLAEELLRSLLWFHPLVGALLAEIDLAREQVIDREVVRLTGLRRAYLEALFEFACRPPLVPVGGAAFLNRRHLQERVAQLTKEVPMSRARRALSVFLASGALVLATVAGLASFPLAQSALAATGSEQPMAITGNVVPPKRLSSVPPSYPAALRKDNVEGTVVLDTVITSQGEVTKVRVAGSSGHAEMDQAAVDAAKQWRFESATLDGKKVSVRYSLTFRFTLDDDKKS